MLQVNKEMQCRNRKIEMDENHQSDHLLVTRAMCEFLQAKLKNNATEYCQDNFLMLNAMDMLHDLKTQYAKYLFDLGFIKTTDYTAPEYNRNSNNIKLLKCVLVAGFCPNIAVRE